MSYDYIEHHGILGQKWGIRRYQNPDGTLTDEGKKRYDKIANSDDARYIYKHRKELSEEDFNKAYKRAKQTDELRRMGSSVPKEIAIATGKEMATTGIKILAVAGTIAFLAKTETGKNLVNKGKTAAISAMREIAKESAHTTAKAAESIAKTTVSVAADTVKKTSESVKTTAQNHRKADSVRYARAIRNGNQVMRALDSFGKTVDKIGGRK